MNRLVAFIRSRAGSVSVFTLVMLPAIIIALGIATDFNSLSAQKRQVQTKADLSALSAIRKFETAESLRQAAATTHAAPASYDMRPLPDHQIILGHLNDQHHFTPAPDQDSLLGVNAVTVIAHSKPKFFVLGNFFRDDTLSIHRRATAVLEPRVSFALSNCLLSMNLFQGFLRPVVGASLDLLCSGHGLRIDALELLETIGVSAGILEPGHTTYGDILDAQVDATTVLEAVLGEDVGLLPGNLRLGEILYLDEKLRRTRIGNPVPRIDVNAADIVFGSAELLHKNVLDLRLGVDLGPVAGADVGLTIGEARQIVVGVRPGDPDAVARTAQIRLDIEDVAIAGLFGLSLNVHLAKAEARLGNGGVTCSELPEQNVAVFSPVEADLLSVDVGVRLLGVSLSGTSAGTYDMATGPMSLTFTRDDYINGRSKSFGPADPGLLSSTRADLRHLTADLLEDAAGGGHTGLLKPVFGLISPVLSWLNGALGQLDSGIGAVGDPVDALLQDVLGLRLAEAQLDLLDISCAGRLAL